MYSISTLTFIEDLLGRAWILSVIFNIDTTYLVTIVTKIYAI